MRDQLWNSSQGTVRKIEGLCGGYEDGSGMEEIAATDAYWVRGAGKEWLDAFYFRCSENVGAISKNKKTSNRDCLKEMGRKRW